MKKHVYIAPVSKVADLEGETSILSGSQVMGRAADIGKDEVVEADSKESSGPSLWDEGW